MKKFLIFILAFLNCTFIIYALDLTGKVTDMDNFPLPGVTMRLQNLNDSTQQKWTTTNEDGDFIFSQLLPAKYFLTASMVGMETFQKNIDLTDTTHNSYNINIILSENAVMLQEAVVTATKASIIAKQDTLEYNAGSFHTSQNATVNDLLKKLPGVEVGSDGSITSNGKTITKILVDGKEFSATTPRWLLKICLPIWLTKYR